ncbi:hypothetical protein NA56DRAFT_750824 [Hyaloscypha hepaticicola]|uniref:Uncharacterized protein n=1 Tax=Hyaloscypha hepaticicola TaxID=2082293 RepID=A0A2J6PY22_9HELO|nr:hypothetical protein NA56DRAFT_750824 [Hyaloscypha hepaticicola]
MSPKTRHPVAWWELREWVIHLLLLVGMACRFRSPGWCQANETTVVPNRGRPSTQKLDSTKAQRQSGDHRGPYANTVLSSYTGRRTRPAPRPVNRAPSIYPPARLLVCPLSPTSWLFGLSLPHALWTPRKPNTMSQVTTGPTGVVPPTVAPFEINQRCHSDEVNSSQNIEMSLPALGFDTNNVQFAKPPHSHSSKPQRSSNKRYVGLEEATTSINSTFCTPPTQLQKDVPASRCPLFLGLAVFPSSSFHIAGGFEASRLGSLADNPPSPSSPPFQVESNCASLGVASSQNQPQMTGEGAFRANRQDRPPSRDLRKVVIAPQA